MTVGVVTDSAASVPVAMAEARGITVVPLVLTIGGVAHFDGEVALTHLLPRFGEGVSTSGPSPGAFAAAVDAALETHDEVVVCTISSSMSSTFDAARAAAAAYGPRVRVIDTGTAAGAEALVVLAAADAAARGASGADVEAAARRVMAGVRLVATVDDLDQLVRSGRVPQAAGWAGSKLHVNPLFEFRVGRVRPLRPAFSRVAALTRIVATWRATEVEGATLHAVALHAGARDDADRLLGEVRRETGSDVGFITEFSPVMVAHTGTGLAGLAWWWEPPGPVTG